MTYNEVQIAYQVLRKLYRENQIDELAYYKLVILYAADYSILGYIEDAVGLLSSVPNDHFRNELPRQLTEDPLFREKVLFLSQDLVDCKKVTLTEDDPEDSLIYRVMLGSNQIGKA